MFHMLCYTLIKMQTGSLLKRRTSWSTWADFLRVRGLEGLAVWVLEAARPLTLLGAQALYLSGPLLQSAFLIGQIDELAGMLEDHDECLAFVALLREEVPS
jgi:hypothetical protein